jgi:hypothetical protein
MKGMRRAGKSRDESGKRILGLKDVAPTTPGQRCKELKAKGLLEEERGKLLKTKG